MENEKRESAATDAQSGKGGDVVITGGAGGPSGPGAPVVITADKGDIFITGGAGGSVIGG